VILPSDPFEYGMELPLVSNLYWVHFQATKTAKTSSSPPSCYGESSWSTIKTLNTHNDTFTINKTNKNWPVKVGHVCCRHKTNHDSLTCLVLICDVALPPPSSSSQLIIPLPLSSNILIAVLYIIFDSKESLSLSKCCGDFLNDL
jgi:hypothetical protein